MRIGNEYSGFGDAPQDPSHQRREAFKRSHRPGEVVRARFVEWEVPPPRAEAPGLAWVQVDGSPLRAPLCGNFAPGDRFLLQVMVLEPEIVLSMTTSETPSEGEAASSDGAPRRRLHITI